MPSFHWPRTSIHENMWNSKSCPDGLPRQKKGVMASRQAPANTKAREMGFLSKWPLRYTEMTGRRITGPRCPPKNGHPISKNRGITKATPDTNQQFYCIGKFSEN